MTRRFLLELARDWFKRENRARTLIQANWLARGDAAHVPDSELDPFSQPEEKTQKFFEGLTRSAGSFAGDTSAPFAKITQHIQKIQKGLIDGSNYEIREVDVQVVSATYRIVEGTPEIGATRGFLMKDCSTGAYAYAYSPMEYTFIVYDPKGEPD